MIQSKHSQRTKSLKHQLIIIPITGYYTHQPNIQSLGFTQTFKHEIALTTSTINA